MDDDCKRLQAQVPADTLAIEITLKPAPAPAMSVYDSCRGNRERRMRYRHLALGTAAVIAATAMAASAQVAPPASPATAQEARRAAAAGMPDSSGTGPYPAVKEMVASLPDHVVYRPADLAALGSRKLGILIWGNGGCSADGASARHHLAEIASHGYVAIAPGTIRSGPGAPAPTTAARAPNPAGQLPPVATTSADLIAAIDWAYAENKRAGSPFFGKLDTAKLAVAGHSCGGLQALEVAPDPRIRAVIINNSGVFADGSNPIPGITVNKAMLKRLHTPVLYILGGPTDIAYPNGMDDFRQIDTVPVMVANLDVGHGGTFGKPNGGAVASVAVDWLDWQLSGDKRAAARFTGKDCGLCTDPAWKIERKRID
jgi:hypothetical protein